MAQPGQTPKGEPQRRTHNFNVRDPEVAGSKTPVSEIPAPGTCDCSVGAIGEISRFLRRPGVGSAFPLGDEWTVCVWASLLLCGGRLICLVSGDVQ